MHCIAVGVAVTPTKKWVAKSKVGKSIVVILLIDGILHKRKSIYGKYQIKYTCTSACGTTLHTGHTHIYIYIYIDLYAFAHFFLISLEQQSLYKTLGKKSTKTLSRLAFQHADVDSD